MTKVPRRRRIAVVSTGRADYGLLHWVLRGLERSPTASLQLILMGMHYSRRHGSTHRAVTSDGFHPAAEIRVVPRSDSDADIARSIGRSTIAMTNALERLHPDLLVVLGDRYELLAATAAATIFRLPIAHLHGGESTEGLIDEAVRHAVTKLSHLHLVAARPYAERLIRMGEEPWRVQVVGSPGLDHLARTRLPDPRDVLRRIGMPEGDERRLVIVTQHPTTLHPGETRAEANALARALSRLDARIVITAANADQEHRQVFDALGSVRNGRANVRFVATLGTAAYWSLLREADLLVGNSSSGLLEAPSFGTPVINIGDRQSGRLRSANVIDVTPTTAAIERGIARALTPGFRASARRARNPYGTAGASDRIVRILTSIEIDKRLLRKKAPG